MLQRDYILRLIREFMAALARMLEKKEVSDRREALIEMYNQYVGPYTLYHNATIDVMMRALESYEEDERLQRMEMLAELYYAEADTVGQPDRDFLLEKSFFLFEWIDRKGNTFSFERRNKMQKIKGQLAENGF
ncbi:MAG: hypothetical protein MR536_09670 [Prevotella sp.]|nr:hypothetical protein [Prevotella sp.]MDD7461945.1 hypothetical protein [Prevotellaceae bacterium]